jgi:hypothetical protein
MYNYEAELVLRSYLPKKLEKGMLFATVNEHGTTLWELEAIPGDKDRFLVENGAPMEICIIDENGDILAEPHEIGWFDEGEHTEELRPISLEDINIIINEYEGWLDIEIYESFYDEEISTIIPNFVEQKVVIKFLTEEEEDENYEEKD